MAAHSSGVVAGEIDGQGRDLLRLQAAAQKGGAALDLFQRAARALGVVGQPYGSHRRLYRAGADGVDGHAAARHLQGQGAGEAQQPVLAGRVGRAVDQPDFAHNRGDVNNAPGLALHHLGQHPPDELIRHCQIDQQHPMPEGVVVVDDGPGAGAAADARVVDQNVDVAQGRAGVLEDAVGCALRRQVRGDDRAAPAQPSHFDVQRGQFFLIAPGGRDVCALCGKGQGNGPSNAFAGSGDEGGFAVQFHWVLL